MSPSAALVLLVCGSVLDLRVLLHLPVRIQSFAVLVDLSAVFLQCGSVIMKTTAGTDLMRSVRLPVLLNTSAALVEHVYLWSSGVMDIQTAPTNQMRTSVHLAHLSLAVLSESSGVRTDAVCRSIKSVTGGWIVGLLMTLMNMVCLCIIKPSVLYLINKIISSLKTCTHKEIGYGNIYIYIFCNYRN